MYLRIHHFFDILRDFGSMKPIVPHPYQHSYHLVADEIIQNPLVQFQLVLSCDAICQNCCKMRYHHCTDTITHRSDFKWKEAFNNSIDQKIMETCQLSFERPYTAVAICKISGKYFENADYIYSGNDLNHTIQRILLVKKGIEFYKDKHNLNGCTNRSGI
jgi:hypothetical protein